MGSAIALWSAAVGLWKDNAVAKPAAVLGRAEVLTRYRHLRESASSIIPPRWISCPRMR